MPPRLVPSGVAVVVSDRVPATRWYRQKLGLSVVDRKGHWVTVGDRRRGIRLHLCAARKFDPMARPERGTTGILFEVDGDVEKAYRSLERRGVRFSHPPKKMEGGWYCTFLDPDGHEFWPMPRE
ncbi:MAG: VOC family protein [Thermoplasmata archaeon]